MKYFIAIILVSVNGVAAFPAPTSAPKAFSSHLRMSDTSVVQIDESVLEAKSIVAIPTPPVKSQALPWVEVSSVLDGRMAGDVGFDPLRFAKSERHLANYREAEIKHARLAMLAAAGWPLSELYDKKIANLLSITPLLDENDRVPSLLNGGLDKVSPAYWAACLILASGVELYGMSQKTKSDYFPGNLGIDPLGLYPKDVAGKKTMQLKEIKNGRLAMIAIFGFAFQEFVSKIAVINETPLFFKPISVVLREYANSGYSYPDSM